MAKPLSTPILPPPPSSSTLLVEPIFDADILELTPADDVHSRATLPVPVEVDPADALFAALAVLDRQIALLSTPLAADLVTAAAATREAARRARWALERGESELAAEKARFAGYVGVVEAVLEARRA